MILALMPASGFSEAQQALDRRMGLGMDDAKLQNTMRDAASSVITGFNKGATFKKFNKSGERLFKVRTPMAKPNGRCQVKKKLF